MHLPGNFDLLEKLSHSCLHQIAQNQVVTSTKTMNNNHTNANKYNNNNNDISNNNNNSNNNNSIDFSPNGPSQD